MSRTRFDLKFHEVQQEIGTFYSTVIPAQTLLEICTFDFRKIEENNGIKEFLGIQRPLKMDRVKEIQKFIRTSDGCFPTSIVISVDERCVTLNADRSELTLHSYEDQIDQEIVIAFRGIATIIDGQHRLKAFEQTDINWGLSVNIFVGIDEGTQASIFSKVNLAQTKVNKSLVYDLFALDKGRSPEKTCHEIVVALNSISESPFFERIKRLGSATDGIFGETLSQATVVKGILPYITKDPMTDRDIGKRIGVFPDRGAADFERRIFYPFFQKKADAEILAILINYFSAVKEKWPDAWSNTGTGAILSRTNGFNGLIRFLRDVYLTSTTQPAVISKAQFAEVFARCTITDEQFSPTVFPPGSSGAAELYRQLCETTGIKLG
jgi:DGQHR domain-containing protein